MSIKSRVVSALVAFAVLLPWGPALAANETVIDGEEVVSNQAIIRIAEDVVDVEQTLAELGYEVIEELGDETDRTYVVELDPFASTSRQINNLESEEVLEFAEPNFIFSVGAVSNDPKFTDGSLWGMGGSATSPASAYGSNAASAWGAGYTGNSNVYVAVLDSGVDALHPDLDGNVWVNSGETAGDGIDNDGNGFVDDVNGYDFVRDDGSVFDIDEHYHGTHVAGTIAAEGGNGVGVAGVAWNVKLISAKMINSQGEASASQAVAAINYVTKLRTQKGLDIIAMNASWGGSGYSEAMERAIEKAGDAGIVFVAAAGNGNNEHVGRNLDSANTYPAEIDCRTESRDWDCVVAVAAIDSSGELAGFSDYSANSVDIAAPGVGVWSTYTVSGASPTREYRALSGTSMAAPHVTGAIALCVSSYRGTSAKLAISKLLSTAAATASVSGKVATNGRLDAAALTTSCVSDTAAFSGLHSEVYASAIYTDRIRLDWVDGVIGDYEQEIQVSIGPSGCTGTFSHLAYIGPGLTSFLVEDLDEAQFYCFRVRANVLPTASYSNYIKSNVSITWTSNLPFVYGKVFLDDGVTPVANAPVKWVASGQSSSSATGVTVKTDVGGNYVTQVSNGTRGTLSVELPISPNAKIATTPAIPWGVVASGALTVNQDTVVNLKMPKLHQITFRVTDAGNPVQNAKVSFGELAKYCRSNSGYLPFVGATESYCRHWPAGYSGSNLRTAANGEITLAFLDGSYFSNPTHLIAIQDPLKPGRVKSISLNPTASEVISVEMPTTSMLTGKVVLDDGSTSVAGIPVYWRADSQYEDSNNTGMYGTVTDSSGNYSLEVADGTPGHLYAATSLSASATAATTPRVPWGLRAGGALTLTADRTVNLKLPEQHIVTLQVSQYDSSTRLQNAKVQYAALAEYCNGNLYTPFAGATNASCRYWATGVSSSVFKTNASGEISFAVLDDKHFSGTRNRRYSVQDPLLSSRVAEVLIAVDQATTIPVSMPGPVTISGKVTTNEGVPVVGVPIKWVADSQYSSNGNSSAQAVTGAGGVYSLDVSMGTPGELFVETTRTASSGPVGTPQVPWGLKAGGKLTANTNTVVDFKLPEYHMVNFTVREMSDNGPGEPVNNATIKYDVLAQYCQANTYTPFAGAGSPNCSYWPVGYSHSGAKTNSSGVVNIPLLAPRYFTNNTYLFSAHHPMDPARVKTQSVTAGSNQSFALTMPGTPSQPEQPTAVAGDGTVTLNWTEPWNGGAFIDYYQVWVATDAQGPFELVTRGSCAGEINPTLRTCVVEGLTPGTTYYFAIIAKNVVGYSPMSISVASTPTVTNQSLTLTPVPTVSGSRVVNSVLTATAGSWDAGVTLSYQWRRDGAQIVGANASTYTLGAEDIGAVITVEVTGTKSGFNSVSRVSASGAVVTAADLALTPVPTITGTLTSGQTLQLTAGSWDAGVTLSYQWLRSGTAISGANATSYVLTDSDVGARISVSVTGSKSGYNQMVKVSALTNVIAEPAPVVAALSSQTLTPTPTVSGEPVVGQLLTAQPDAWDQGVTLTYRWLRNGVAIPGATATTYLVAAADAASVISFEVVGTRTGYETVSKVSTAVGPIGQVAAQVVAPPTFVLAPIPTISGSATVGSTLTASVGAWDDGVILSYQWYRGDLAIFGATSSSYQLSASDLGQAITFKVIASKTGLDQLTKASLATALVAAAAVVGGGGGGGGGGGFVSAPVVALPALSKPLPQGAKFALFDADGKSLEAKASVDVEGKKLALTGSGWSFSLEAASGLEVTSDGQAKLESGASVQLGASGYEPDSSVYFYLIPQGYLQAASVGFRSFVAASPIELGSTKVSADGSFAYTAKPNAAAGDYVLQVSGTNAQGDVTSIAISTKVVGPLVLELAAWTKKLSSSSVKVYAKNVVGAGKVRFVLNGKEVAWVRASDASDPKLSNSKGSSYLVRTVSLRTGKNVVEIFVDGKRVLRRAATK